MKLHPQDLDFLLLFSLVTIQGALLFASWSLLGQGMGMVALTFLLGVIALGLLVAAWDLLPWLHPWDRRVGRPAGPRAP